MSWIYTGEDPGHVRVTGIEDAPPSVVVELRAMNEVERAIDAIDDSLATVQRLTRPDSTPSWLPPLLAVAAGLYLYVLIRLFDSTIGRLLP